MVVVQKLCPRCGEAKTTAEFHKRSRSRDGLQAYCKTCDKATSITQRATLQGRSYIQLWRDKPEAKFARQKYRKRESVLDACRRRAVVDRHASPEKALARSILNKAVASGKIVRPIACESCESIPGPAVDGRSQIQGHHRDHSRPLEVSWVCVKCHRRLEGDQLHDAE